MIPALKHFFFSKLGFDGYYVAIAFVLLGWEFGWQKFRFAWLGIPVVIHYVWLSMAPYGYLGFRLTTLGCVMAASLSYIFGRVARHIFGGGAKLSLKMFRLALRGG